MAITTPIFRPVKPTFNAGSGLRSPLDKDDLTNAHKKVITPNASTFNLAIQLQQLSVLVNKLRRRVLTPPTQAAPAVKILNPFSIYQINNITDPTLSAFTFQMRSGVVGVRSANFLTNSLSQDFNTSTFGNFEIPLEIASDGLYGTTGTYTPSFSAVPIPNQAGNAQLLNGTDIQINASGASLSNQIVLDQQQEGGTFKDCLASLWLVLIDDPILGLKFQLWGRMFTNNASSTLGRVLQPFPDPDPSIIPIGIIGNASYTTAAPFVILQLQSGNLINRFNPGVISGATASPTYQRGYWTTDSLSGQAFWDGDNVVDDSHIIVTISGSNFYGTYSYIGGSNIETASPFGNANFKLTGMVIL